MWQECNGGHLSGSQPTDSAHSLKLLKELDIKPTSKPIDNRIPYGWTFSGSSSDYEAGVARNNVHSGHASGYLKKPIQIST